MDQRFDILFEGDLVPGKSGKEVKEKLAKLMNADLAGIERLFERTPAVLRRGVTQETAKRFLGAFDRAGAICRMVPAETGSGAEPPPRFPKDPPSDTRPGAHAPPPGPLLQVVDRSAKNPFSGGRMILTNIESVPGKTIVEHFGLVSGSTIRAKHVGRDIMASLKNLVGGELKGYTQLLQESRTQAVDRMIAQAKQLGGNAVINVRFSTSSVAQGAAELYAYGTAVRVE
ncbi:MAG: YbjQ family protein [Desulfobacterales bacterium]|nr:YbjQ family protein [Desulfobacterales bacterium]